jgi:hypothetical protein
MKAKVDEEMMGFHGDRIQPWDMKQ